jgi:hypothetical protein
MRVLGKVMCLVCMFLFGIVAGCGGSQSTALKPTSGDGFEIIFSLANRDRESPVVLADVLLDETTVFHGALHASPSGEYTYVSTRVSKQKMKLVFRTAVGEDIRTLDRKIWVDDRTWIVLTRIKEYDREPELEMEISYEKEQPGKK